MIEHLEVASKVKSTYEYYESYALEYFQATFATDLSKSWSKLEARLHKNDLVLDIGSGSGRDIRHFAQNNFRTIGLDYSVSLAKLAHRFAERPQIVGDFLHIPCRENSVDAIWSIGSLLHVERYNLTIVLNQLQRVMKNGAFLFSAIKKGQGESLDELGRYSVFYQLPEWSVIMQACGFEIIDIEEVIEYRKISPTKTIEVSWIECLSRVHKDTIFDKNV